LPQLQAGLDRPVHFIATRPGAETEAALDRLPGGCVVLMENLRFCPSEQRSPRSFAIRLSCLADRLYIDPANVPAHAWALELANLLPAAMPHAPNMESTRSWPG
jgi:3-phosphoglycerate kinase